MERTRSWFRITWSIRTLLLITALVSVGFAWQVPRWRKHYAIKTLGEIGAGLEKRDGKIHSLTLPDLNLGYFGAIPTGGVDAWKSPERMVAIIGEVDTLESIWIVPGDLRSINLSPWLELHRLKNIQISDANLSKANIEVIAALPSLESLSLTGSTFEGDALRPLTRCKQLRSLRLSRNSFVVRIITKDALSDNAKNSESHEELPSDHGTIDSKKLAAMCGMESLKELELWWTDIDDLAIDVLLSFPNLEEVNLLNTRVTRDGVARLLRESKIERLQVESKIIDELSGELTDTELARLKR